jgi:hypothetical protein
LICRLGVVGKCLSYTTQEPYLWKSIFFFYRIRQMAAGMWLSRLKMNSVQPPFTDKWLFDIYSIFIRVENHDGSLASESMKERHVEAMLP